MLVFHFCLIFYKTKTKKPGPGQRGKVSCGLSFTIKTFYSALQRHWRGAQGDAFTPRFLDASGQWPVVKGWLRVGGGTATVPSQSYCHSLCVSLRWRWKTCLMGRQWLLRGMGQKGTPAAIPVLRNSFLLHPGIRDSYAF